MHLTLLEHGVYRQLLDLYYLDECELDANALRKICARSADEIHAAETILNEFFYKTENGYKHKRCDEEIAKFHEQKQNHWAKKLPNHIRTSIQAKRNAAKVNGLPKWLTKEHKEKISEIYARAALLTVQTGIKHEVDHIVPLRSKLVCGLHVAWNLQVIKAYENRLKSNIFEVR